MLTSKIAERTRWRLAIVGAFLFAALVGCGVATPRPTPTQPVNAPAVAPIQQLPSVPSGPCIVEEYNQRESDGSISHVQVMCDGTFRVTPIAPPTARPPSSSSCPRGCEVPPPGCVIKGNISFNTGEKIYHLPGQKYYDSTVIDPRYGERWFCTEQEAIANGWRKSQQ